MRKTVFAASLVGWVAMTAFAEAQTTPPPNTGALQTGLDRADIAAGDHGKQGRDNARTRGNRRTTTTTSTSAATPDTTRLRGLDRADQAATDQHGQQGRDRARAAERP